MKAARSILLLLLCLVILGSIHIAVNAQNTAENALSNIKKHSEYALAYPGILPDHPLYPLKMTRDKTIEFLILDPIKKAEFYLLQADKRLSAGITLFYLGKTKTGEETISKGEKYFHLAVLELEKNKTVSTGDVLDRTLKAAEKHEEEIGLLITKSNNASIKEGLGLSLSSVRDFYQRTLKIKQQLINKKINTAQ